MEKLRISENGRYFIKEDGSPFVWLADTVWTMPQRMKWDDVIYLMEKRKSQGFTVLQMVALDPERDVEMRNPAGEKALFSDCLDEPNETYFKYLYLILDRAEEYGFYVLLLPVWGQLVVGDDWTGKTFPKTVTEENAFNYGKWIGNRYKDRNQIVWCLGGDRQPVHKGVDYKNVWRRMAEGLAKGLTGKAADAGVPSPVWEELLLTYHACHERGTGECSSLSYWEEKEPWIRFVMLQSGHGLIAKNYELVKREYNRSLVRPVWDGEPAYEDMPTAWPPTGDSFHDTWMVRKRAYWSLLAGSFGHTYGHSSVWCSISEKEQNIISRISWFQALDSKGSQQMKYLRDFMEATNIMTCVPCQEMIAQQDGSEEMDRHIQACRNPEGKFCCVYFPSGGSAALYLDRLALNENKAYLWWWNPRDGKFCEKGPKHMSVSEGPLKVCAPSEGAQEDWVLLVTSTATDAPIPERTYFSITKKEEGKSFDW